MYMDLCRCGTKTANYICHDNNWRKHDYGMGVIINVFNVLNIKKYLLK